MLRRNRHRLLVAFVVGIIAMLLLLFGVRVITAKSDAVHYHADFALYVNGVRDEFNGPGYFEEVQACTADKSNDPKARVHMHNQENSIVTCMIGP